MSLGLWTLIYIREKIKKLTATDLTDAEIDICINRYYQIIFPMELRPLELQTWFEADLTAGTSEYTLASLSFDDSYLTLDNPCYISDIPMILSLDPSTFYAKYPQDQTYDNGCPSDILLYDNKLTFMQPPSSDYLEFKASAWTRPSALDNDSDTPIREEWGSIIAYGSSLEVLEDTGDFQTLQLLMPMYEEKKIVISRKRSQQFYKRRSIPSF